MLNNPNNVHINHSTVVDVGRDNYIYYGDKSAMLRRLGEHVAAGAFHNSGERFDPPKCHPRTRTAVLEKIRCWYKDKDAEVSCVMWMHGPAGAGKSAIAQTMAEECHALCTLAASFFFSRMAPDRNNAAGLVATIAYQIAQNIPDTQPYIFQAIENDPIIFQTSLENQLYRLVVQPLRNAVSGDSIVSGSWPKLIIIDGLDECNGRESQQAIIHCFSSALAQYELPLRLLLSCRPEQPIRESFSRSNKIWNYLSLVLGNEYLPDKDIELVLEDKFDDIRRTHVLGSLIPKTWPSHGDICALVQKSSGQFIFAATVIRYVQSPRHQPMDRLQRVLGVGNQIGDSPFKELYALYMYILKSTDEAQHNVILRIFGCLLCRGANWPPLTPLELENLLSLKPGDVQMALVDCHSIIQVPSPHTEMHMHFYHASISEFFLDSASSQEFYLGQGKIQAELAQACMKGIYSSWRKIRLHSTSALPEHCYSADIDYSLLKELLCFNFIDLIQTYVSDFKSSWVKDISCLDLFRWVREMAHNKRVKVSKHQSIYYFDQHLCQQIASLSSTSNKIPDMYALADKLCSSSWQPLEFVPLLWAVPGEGLLDVWNHVWLLLGLEEIIYPGGFIESSFLLSHSFGHGNRGEFEDLCIEFFCDWKRAGKYHIGPDVYARVAVQCIKYLHQPHISCSFHTSSPNEYCKYCRIPETYDFGLAALPSILSLAAPLEDLAYSLQSKESTNWPEVQDAQAEYLKVKESVCNSCY